MDIVSSKKGVPIRLTEERWFHIIENHDDLAGHYDDVLYAIEDPNYIIEGYRKALIALKKSPEPSSWQWCIEKQAEKMVSL